MKDILPIGIFIFAGNDFEASKTGKWKVKITENICVRLHA